MNLYTQIVGVGSGFPERVMTNKEFESFIETSDEWIRTRTGIETRRIADPNKGETTRSLALEASRKALAMANTSASDLDLIIVGSVTPDSLMPTTANLLQRDLIAPKAFSFDLQAACSGFLYALSIADQYIRTGSAKTALVVGAETLSTITDWKDRSTCILFGDGAGAAVLKATTDQKHGILSTRCYSDGTKGEILKLPRHAKIIMQGSEVFKLAVRAMVDASQTVLTDAGLKPSDVDFFIFHQANSRIIDMCLKMMDVPLEKTWLNVAKYGNTSAATLPVCLDEAWKAGKVKPGDTILMATFGGGVTWGASVFNL